MQPGQLASITMKFRLLNAILISLFTCNLTAYAEAEVRGRILDAQSLDVYVNYAEAEDNGVYYSRRHFK